MTVQSKKPEARLHLLAVSAWKYEQGEETPLTDAEFDKESEAVRTLTFTDPVIIEFMQKDFEPFTGMWIYKYPYKDFIR